MPFKSKYQPLDKLAVPNTQLPIMGNLEWMMLADETPHPILRVLRLPPLEKLPRVATQLRILIPSQERNPYAYAWTECPYKSREDLFRDAVALTRGHRWQETGSERVERKKWIARRLPEKQGPYSFGLPVVQLYLTQWSHVELFDGRKRERNWVKPRIGHYVPAEATRAYLWEKYGLNLALLAAYEEAPETLPARFGDALPSIITPESAVKALVSTFSKGKLTRQAAYAPKISSLYLGELKHAPDFTAEYVSLNDVAILIGHIESGLFDFVKGHDPAKLNPSNPALSCGIRFEAGAALEMASVIFTDGPGLTPNATAPLPGGLKGKPLDTFRKLLRLRSEIGEARARLLGSADREMELRLEFGSYKAAYIAATPAEAFADDANGKAEAIKAEQAASQELNRISQERLGLMEERTKKRVEARALYLDILRTVARDKERILLGKKQYAEAKSRSDAREGLLVGKRATYTHLADVGSEAFAHMTVLPAGVDVQVVPFREASLGIAALRMERPGFRNEKPLQLEMRELYPREGGLPSLMDAANAALRMPGLFAVGYVGFAKLAKDANAYERLDNIETLATDFWCAINPPRVREDIRTDGLENWWKNKHRSVKNPVECTATDAFVRLALFLNDVGIPISTRNRTGVISGIIQLGAVEKVHRNGGNVAAIKWRPNPELSRLITGGEGVTPHYMVVNHAAMFGYGGTERNVCPAMQLWCEHRTRAAYFSGNLYKYEGWLITPGQDGTQLGTIAERMGFPEGRYPREALRRISAGLESLQRAGVVSEIQWGAKRRNAFEQQVKIRMSGDYLPLYDGARLNAEVRKCAEFLAAPFTPPKRAGKPA